MPISPQKARKPLQTRPRSDDLGKVWVKVAPAEIGLEKRAVEQTPVGVATAIVARNRQCVAVGEYRARSSEANTLSFTLAFNNEMTSMIEEPGVQ